MSLYYLYPTDIPTIESGWSGGSRPPCVYSQINDLYGQYNDDLTTGCIHWLEDSAGALPSAAGYKVLVTFDQLPPVFSISNVRIFYRIERDSSSYNGQEFKPALWVSGAAYLPSGVAGFAQATYGFYNLAYDFAVNPATAVAWTRSDINVVGLGAFFARNTDITRTNGVFVSAMTLIVDAIGQPMQRDSAVAVASRTQRRYTSSARTVSVNVPYEVGLNVGPNDVLPISHFAGAHNTDPGWGQNFWQYLPTLLDDFEINPDGHVTVKGIDVRRLWCLFYDSMWPKSLSPLIGDGVIRINKGLTRTYVRASLDYAQDPSSLQYISLSNDQEVFDARGELFQRLNKNLVQYSAFQTGSFTGWTATGVGDHGASITAEVPGAPTSGSPGVMWDPNSTGVNQCALFIAGTAGWASDLYLTSTATASIPSGTIVPVSFWYSNPIDGQSPQVSLKRAIDGRYFNFNTNSWVVGIVWTTLPTGNPGVVQRYDALVNVGLGGATTLQAIVGLSVAAVPPIQASRFHCVQIDDQCSAFSSPIITTNATGTRQPSMLTLSNNTGRRMIDMTTSWTLAFELIPNYSGADLLDRFFFTLRTNGSANDFMTISHIASASLRFRINRAGVVTDLAYGEGTPLGITNWNPALGTPVKFVVRQTQLGEFGEATNTVSIFIGGTKIATKVMSPPVFSSAMTATIGSDSTLGVSPCDSVIRKFTVLQFAADDIECRRLP